MFSNILIINFVRMNKVQQYKNEVVENYKLTTPIKARNWGNALMGVSHTIAGFAIMDEMKWLAITALIVGSIGKGITELYKEVNGTDHAQ